MAENYDITYDGASVGTAQWEKQGLYYRFSCRCNLPDEGLYRIHVLCGDKHVDLGICVPMEGAFGMDKKIPVKNIGSGEMTFRLLPKDWKQMRIVYDAQPEEMPEVQHTEETVVEPQQEAAADSQNPEEVTGIQEQPIEEEITEETKQEVFIPVSEEEPFAHLDKLEDARFEICDDTPGVVLLSYEDEQMDVSLQRAPMLPLHKGALDAVNAGQQTEA